MGGSSASVPPLVGLSQSAAVSKLTQAGFKAGVQQEYSRSFAQGLVTRQSPAAGTRLRTGEAVDIWISKGAQPVALANFRGWTAKQVQAWLHQNGVTGLQNFAKSGAVPIGRVFRQNPTAGTSVSPGDTISYWVSSGKPPVAVPDLSGDTQSEAQTALAAVGLNLGTVTTQTSTTVPAQEIISQFPTADTKVSRGSMVDVVVSSGSPSPSPSTSPSASMVAVPNVYGVDSGTATTTVESAGFSVVIKQRGGTGQPAGTVVKEVPDANVLAPLGSTVTLFIAK